jgi:hypothetical protein
MMNVYRIINYFGAGICPIPSIMGRVPKSNSIHVQNPTKFFFSQTRIWCGGPGYVMEGKIK